jgi:hypothetical protein
MKAWYLGLQRRNDGLRACVAYRRADRGHSLTESYREFWL